MLTPSRPLNINFASRNYRLLSYLQTGLYGFSIGLALMTAMMLGITYSYRSDIADMDQKIIELSKRDQQASLVLSEREQLTKNFNSMTALVDARRFSWTQLFTNIEALFPVGASLGRIEINPRDQVLLLDGTALSPESLRALIVGMEKSATFKEVVLKHQSVDKGHISFNVASIYHQNTNTGVAAQK